jgi:hypothetical protein
MPAPIKSLLPCRTTPPPTKSLLPCRITPLPTKSPLPPCCKLPCRKLPCRRLESSGGGVATEGSAAECSDALERDKGGRPGRLGLGLRAVWRLGSAPFSNKTFMSWWRPFVAAIWIGVSPSWFLWLQIVPWCTRNTAAASLLSRAARCSRELPLRVSTASTLDPLLISREAKVWSNSLVSSDVR